MDIDDRQTALDQFAAMSRTRDPGDFQPVAAAAHQAVFEPPRGAIRTEVKRDIQTIVEEIKQYAAFSGQEWYYRFPVKDRKTNSTNYIEGPSIKLANDLIRLYKNCDIDCRVIDLGDNWLIYSRFVDLENGVTITRPFMQRKNASRLGGDDDGRRQEIALAIGVSKSIRNVVVNALQSFSEMAFTEAKNSLVEKIGKDLGKWRERTAEKLSAQVDLARVEAVIGKKVNEWLAPDVAKIIAMAKSVQDGFSSLDETFPPLDNAATSNQQTGSALDDFAGQTAQGGPAQGSDAAAKHPPHKADNVEATAKDGESGGTGAAPPVPPGEFFERLRVRLSQSETLDACQEAWDQMDPEGHFQADKLALDRAKKIYAARRKELEG